MTAFALDRRLAAETVPVTGLDLCRVLLRDDARTAWAILVPERDGLVELHDLLPEERVALIDEVAAVSAALSEITGAQKINTGALGNIVRQLHIHVVARNEGDFAWPGPVWGVGERVPMAPSAREAMAEELRGRL